MQNHTGKLWKWSGNERRRGKGVDYHMDQRMWQRDRSREAGAGTGPGMDWPKGGSEMNAFWWSGNGFGIVF